MGKDREEEEASRGFKVQDRRRFTDEAATASTDEAAPPPAPEAQPSEPPPVAESHADTLPELSFSSFVVGLYQQALMHLGEIPDPHGPGGADLEAARQMIDLLGILRDKTTGNLDTGEAQLLDNMLYDLRMRYVEVSRAR